MTSILLYELKLLVLIGLDVVFHIAEKVIDGCEVLQISDIAKMYLEVSNRLSGDEDNVVLMTNQKLKRKF